MKTPAHLPSPPVPTPAAAGRWRLLLACAAVVIAIKLAGIAVDPVMRVFMGDSGTYFHTALTGWIPPDRSFLYGWLVGATAIPTRSAFTLLALQSGFGAIGALLLFAWLRSGLQLRTAPALAAAALFALEPAQMFYERMMMAEATGFACFVLFFAALSRYVARGRLYWIAVAAGFGVLAVAMRISLLPVVLALSLLAPLVRALFESGLPRFGWRWAASLALHLAIAGGATWLAHDAYQRWYGELMGVAPAYTAKVGTFRLGLVAPLVEARHFRGSGVPPQMLEQIRLDYRDPRQREAQIWAAGGMLDTLSLHTSDPERAASKISIKAAREQPLRLAAMGLRTQLDYFEPFMRDQRLEDDMGIRPPHARMLADLQQHLRYDASQVHATRTPAWHWFALGSHWLVLVLMLLAPLALLALWLGRREPGLGLRVLLALASCGLVAGHVLFSHIISFRYLHPLPWFFLANLALVASALLQQRAQASAARAGIPSNAR